MTTAMAAAAAASAAAPWSPLAPAQPRLFKKRPLQQLLPESYDAPNDDEAGAFEPTAAAAFDFAPVRRQSLLLQLNNNNHKPQLHLASAPASLAQGPHYDSGVGSPAAYTDSDEESEGEDVEDGEGEDQGDEQEDRRLPFKKRRCHSTLHDSEGEGEENEEDAAPQQPGKKMADRYQQRCVQSQTPGASGAHQQQQE